MTLDEWLDPTRPDSTLTRTELRILGVLASRFGSWVPALAIIRAVYREHHHRDAARAEIHTFRQHLYRIRRKIAESPYRVENHYWFAEYRLVHV